MEGEKERERERGEEKESDEAEEEERDSDEAEYEEEEEEEEEEDTEGAALVWQEGYGEDDLGLPIMHWEALSLRIAELEKQEEERKEKAKSAGPLERARAPVNWMDDRERGRRTESWEDGEDDCNSRVMALTSRLQTQMNLQLCFINNSESEDEEEKEEESKKKVAGKRGTVQVPQQPQAPAAEKSKPSRGIKSALRSLRDKLRTEKSPACDPPAKKRRLERSDLQAFSVKELTALRTSLSQSIQDLSTELVGRLQARDQLRTEQDAMLLEVQDLTSL